MVRLSFDGKNYEPGDLEGSILNQLAIIERNAGLDPAPSTLNGPVRLMDLLDRLCHKTGKQAVVLVDEYDKPILDVLDDPEQAEASGSGHYLSTFRTSGTTPAVSTSSRPTMRACCTCVFALSAPTFR